MRTLSTAEIEELRADTPACERVIHFNNAGASLMPDPVFAALASHLELEREVGGYEAEQRAAGELDAFYREFAALLDCAPREIAYVENATRAWDMAFYALPLGKGDRVLTHGSEYASNFLALLHRSRRCGFDIDIAPSDASGQVDVAALESLIGARTRLIAITHVPTQGGLVNPAEAIGSIARKHGVTYLLDACQSVGQLPLNVHDIGCDILTGTGRKFLRGPRGTGFLYVSDAILERLDPPFIDMRAATWTDRDAFELAPGARRFENWESFVAGRIGLATAVRYARAIGIDRIEQRAVRLAAALRDALAGDPAIEVYDLGERQCGIVTFRIGDEAPEATARRLLGHGINVSVTTRTSAQIDFAERDLDALVRASVHYYNTDAEIDRFVETARNVA